MRVGELIRAWRNERRIGVREMAKTLGISHATLSRLERGLACDSGTAFRVMVWLFEPKRAGEGGEARTPNQGDDDQASIPR